MKGKGNLKKTTVLEKITQKEKKTSKEQLFFTISFALQGREEINEGIIYFGHVVEALSFLWFTIHPALNIFDPNIYLFGYLSTTLKFINFYEYMADGVNYQIQIWVVLGYYILFALATVITKNVEQKRQQDSLTIFLRNLINICFTFSIDIFTLSFLGVAVNVLYCTDNSPYHPDGQCYDLEHIVYCCLAAFILLVTTYFPFAGGLLFFSRSPFDKGQFSHPNRNYIISKYIIKLLCVVYFALNSTLRLEFLFILAAPALWGFYIFYHRINSLRSSNHCHFYKELFLESFIFFSFAISCLLYNFSSQPYNYQMGLLNLLILSLFGALALVILEITLHKKFMKACLLGNIKKQNMNRFVRGLINDLLHQSSKKGTIILQLCKHFIKFEQHQSNKTVSKLLRGQNLKTANQGIGTRIMSQSDQKESTNLNPQDENHIDHQTKTQIYRCLILIVENLLHGTNDIGLKMIKAELLSLLGYHYFSFHYLLELQQQKLSFSEQFTVYEMLKQCRMEIEKTERQKEQSGGIKLQTIYRYENEDNTFEELMNECAANNEEYWDELRESAPSLPKLKDLALKYGSYSTAVANSYAAIQDIFPESCAPTIKYLDFLLQVGIDVQDAIKIRQELKYKFQRKRSQRLEPKGLLGEQNLTMVALDSVGKKLGQVVNCNKHIYGLLGYDKESIINKSIVRIMPKAYADLHNDFILNYLKGQSHTITTHDIVESTHHFSQANKTAEKLVTPITTQGLLVEVILRVHLVAEAQGSLLVIGFLSRCENKEQAVIMVDSTTGLLLGIDSKFQSMINHQVNGKQVLNQEVRLASLLPELNIKQLEREGTQNSILYVENSSDDDRASKTIDVCVQIRRIKYYQGKKLMFLTVSKTQTFNNSLKTSQKLGLCSSLSHISLSHKNTPLSQISFSHQAPSLLELNQKQLSDELPLMKKLKEFTEKFEAKKKLFILNIVYTSSFFVVVVTVLTIMFVYFKILSDAESSYSTLQNMADVPYEVSQISLYTNKIWSVQLAQYRTTNYTAYLPPLRATVLKLAQEDTLIYQKTINVNYPLDYNQNILRNYKIFKTVNGISSYVNISLNFPSALSNYIINGKQLLNPTVTDQMNTVNTELVQQLTYFITANGDQLIPSVALDVVFAYQKFMSHDMESATQLMVLIKVVIAVVVSIFGFGSLIFGIYFTNNQKDILRFYSKLRLWDISELSMKCKIFLEKTTKIKKKQRSSNLIDILPSLSIFGLTIEKQLHKNNKPLRHSRFDNLTVNDEEQPLKQSSGQPIIQNNHIEQKKINLEIRFAKDYWTVVKVLLVMAIICQLIWCLSIYFNLIIPEEMESKIVLLRDISVIRKTMTYLDLYAYQIVSSYPDGYYSSKIATQAELFYQYSGKTFEYIGNQIFSEVYSATELLQKYFTQPSQHSLAFLTEMYNTRINHVLQTACAKIVQLDETVFYPEFQKVIEKARLYQIICSVFCCLFYGLYSWIFINLFITKNKDTISMLKILPAWVVERNSEAHQQVLK